LERPRVATESGLLLKDEVFAIVGAAIEVHRVFGSGFLEAVYHEALELELADRSIPFVSQSPLTINYKAHVLQNRYVVDLVCYGSVLVELKALDRLSSREEAQTLNYLKASQGLRVAVLINFGAMRTLEWKRYVL
jgi:GxxExxY protein